MEFFPDCVPFQMAQSVHSSHDIGKRFSTQEYLFSSKFLEISIHNEDRKFCSVSSTIQYKVWYFSISMKTSALVLKFKSLGYFQTGNVCYVACLNIHSPITATHILLQKEIYVQKKPIIEFGKPELCLTPLSPLDQTANPITKVGTV